MIELKLSEQQLQALVGLIDAGIKATGIAGVKAGAELLGLIEQAVTEARARPAGSVVTDDA